MTAIIGENSYNDADALSAFALSRGVTISGDADQLLIKAMDVIEIESYAGDKIDYSQNLQHPRTVYNFEDGDIYGQYPAKIVKAQLVTALLIDSGENINGVVKRPVKRQKVGPLEKEFMDNAPSVNEYPELVMLLSWYTTGSSGSRVYNG